MQLIRGMKLGLMLCAAGVMAPGVIWPGGTAHAATIASRDDRAETCAKIAELIDPVDAVLANTDKANAAGNAAMFAQNPQLAALDAKYPGLQQAVVVAQRPVIHKYTQQMLVSLHADLARLFATNLTPAEARSYLRFLATPEMQAFARSVRQGENAAALGWDIVENSNHKLTTGELSGVVAASSKKAATHASMQQRMVLGMYANSPLGRKTSALNPQKTAIETRWSNDTPAGEIQEIREVSRAAMIAHIAKTDPAFAESMRTAMGFSSAPLPTAQPAPQPPSDTIVVPAPPAPAPEKAPTP